MILREREREREREIYIYIYIFVGSQFVADRNSVGLARKTALTISFVERGFERLGLDR